MGKTNDYDRSALKKEIQDDIGLFNAMGVNAQTILFKDVYKLDLKEKEWELYAVNELSGEDYNKVKGKCSDTNGNPLWCDLIIDYLLTKHEECSAIHLFLHDQDVSGFSSDSLTHIDGTEECRGKEVLSEVIVKKIGNRKLTITFFQHDNPTIVKLIGEEANENEFQKNFNSFFENDNYSVRKVNRINKTAKKCFEDLESKCRNRLDTIQKCPFLVES